MTLRHLPFASSTWLLSGLLLTLASAGVAQNEGQGAGDWGKPFTALSEPAGNYSTSWVGNSFGGDGGPNGFGYWVQNGADEMEVSPDGTVFVGIGWDESGRCLGLYKDGKVNRVLLKAQGDDLANSAWGWGLATNAFAVSGDTITVANTGKRLLRFHWTPGDIDSAQFLDARSLDSEVVGLAAQGDLLALVEASAVEVRRDNDFGSVSRFEVAGARDAAWAPDGSLWVLAGETVTHYSVQGQTLGAVPGLEKPSAVSFDPRGRLVVCEEGARQQVVFFDVSTDVPHEVATFGAWGGLGAGTPGEVKPDKLFGLRGAGVDAAGNLYVAMSFASPPAAKAGETSFGFPVGNASGGLWLRAFTPQGTLRWSLYNNAFVDTFGFDPASDGDRIYSRNALYELDLEQTEPGREASLRAITVDPARAGDDPRTQGNASVLVRYLDGRRVLFTIGQYGGGYTLHGFDSPDDLIAHQVGQIGGEPGDNRWAWDVAANGDIWYGDSPNKVIRRYAFRGWKDGQAKYAPAQEWRWPSDWAVIRRIKYDSSHDTLYLSGYLEGQAVESWGVIGPTLRRYDGWTQGTEKLVWSDENLPRDGSSNEQGLALTPQSLDIAGDYIFLGLSRPTEGKQRIHILRTSDASYAGSLQPGEAVGENAGWLDMPYAVQAMRRQDGEYLILVEEDSRGKNLLYRWHPAP